jgi:hypothetical protein
VHLLVTLDDFNLKSAHVSICPRGWTAQTYVRMSSDLLNNIVIKMTGITEEVASNVVSVSQPFKDCVLEWELISLSKLGLGVLRGIV